MKTLQCTIALLLLTLASGAQAAQPTPNPLKPTSCTDCEQTGIRVSLALGGSFETYTGENKVLRDFGDSISGRNHYDLDFDFALYFQPTSEHLLFGLLLDLGSDNWIKNPNFARISQLLFGVKAQYYFLGEGVKGPYVEAGLGPVAMVDSSGNTTSRTTQSTTTSSPLGVGVRVGGGYAFKTSDWVSLFVGANWSYRTAGASTAMPVTIQGGILF